MPQPHQRSGGGGRLRWVAANSLAGEGCSSGISLDRSGIPQPRLTGKRLLLAQLCFISHGCLVFQAGRKGAVACSRDAVSIPSFGSTVRPRRRLPASLALPREQPCLRFGAKSAQSRLNLPRNA